jgi:geranylgeranyl pyrophosphate synthase
MSIVNTYKSLDSFIKIEKAFKKDLQNVELHLAEMIKDQPKWFQDVVNHLVQAGGKRIRPLLVLLSYSLVSEEPINKNAVVSAAQSEFVHTATLFHDDVIDDGKERRGKPTANVMYGNHTAILSGDFILGKVFQELDTLNTPKLLSEMIFTVSRLVEGEVHQMDMKQKAQVTFEDYERLIYLKTASLFEWSMIAGGYTSNQDEKTIEMLRKIGNHIGRIFQIVDDILDYTGNAILGKKRLQDFNQGKITLPLLFLFESDQSYFHQWKSCIDNNDALALEKIGKTFIKRIREEDIQEKMKSFLQKDIDGIKSIVNELPESKSKEFINDLISFLVSRMS